MKITSSISVACMAGIAFATAPEITLLSTVNTYVDRTSL